MKHRTTLNEAAQLVPRASPWKLPDGKQYTVVTQRMSAGQAEVVYSLTDDCRVQLVMPVAEFLKSAVRVP